MTNTENFHTSIKPWSKTKNALLENYLTSYFAKIMSFPNTIGYADCFAGIGRLEDGADGSPLIAMKCFADQKDKARIRSWYMLVFSEKKTKTFEKLNLSIKESKYYDQLKEGCNILNGDYSDILELILEGVPSDAHLFFYLDPFGVKDLPFTHFTDIAHRASDFAPGTEILLNFSSPGFLREACCVYSLLDMIPGDFEYIDEGFSEEEQGNDRAIRLSEIAGGTWWQAIISDFKQGKYDFWEAERLISENYCNKLKKLFRFVVNMPIRDKEGKRRVKYRMVHATNHASGCALMNDIMLKRQSDLQVQKTLFPVDFEYVDIHDRLPEISNSANRAVASLEEGKYIKFEDLSAIVISDVGIVMNVTDLNKEAFSKFFDEGVLERRDKYQKNGKPRNTWTGNTMIQKIVNTTSK